ncbi:hypothetical protein [Nocardiopsis sp. FR26]|uniref:DUF7620 family protein n=1 Tax=Nocardiopsis sp. FR26 TaxID=2605987 RepID=UPI00135974C8|nr:hypothetical protein [Nocardiopsis sp. FR26]
MSAKSWFRRGKHRHRATTRRPDPPVTAEEAAEARRCGEQNLADAQARDREVRRVSARLRRERDKNHFSALIWRALQERR